MPVIPEQFSCLQISKSYNEYANVLFSFPDIEVADRDRKSDDVLVQMLNIEECLMIPCYWYFTPLQTSPVIILTLIPPTLLLTSQLD